MSQLQYDPAWLGDAPIAEKEPGEEELAVSDQKGNWPRLIYFSDEVNQRLYLWLDNEIENFYMERQAMLDNWIRWQTLYWAEPETKVKNFPFQKSANIVIPLAAIAVEAIHARMMNTLFSVEPFWSIRPRSKEWIDASKPMELFLQAEVEATETLQVYDFCNHTILELMKLGTCVAKSGYEKLTKKSMRMIGDKEEDFFVDVKNGATIERVPLANFMMRLNELDPQVSPWCGEVHRFSWTELKRMAQAGRMDPDAVERIKSRWIDVNTPNFPGDGIELQKQVEKLANATPVWNEIFEVMELYVTFDINDDGWDEEIVLDYHKESRTILSARYNWYDDLHRPYRICNFLAIEGLWIGMGICKQVEQFQNEATTIRRQRLDNATLANMSQLILRKGMGYGPGEPIFPGKMWFVDDPYKDVKEFKLSEIYPSSFENEASVTRDFEKRSGVNDVIVGIPQSGTPGTATGDLTRLAEGNKRFDLVLKNIKRWLSLIGVDVITNYQIFGDQQAHWLVLGEDGIYVEAVLNMPAILVRKGAIVDLSVTDSITNREVEKQQWLQLFQVVTGYYDRVINIANILAQVTGDPTPILMMSERALLSSDEAVKRLLETFNVPNTARFSLVGETKNGTPGSGGPSQNPNGFGNLGPGIPTGTPRLANPNSNSASAAS